MQGKLNRINRLQEKLSSGSAFLFGPRQTGKSTLIRTQFEDCTVINLLKSEEYLNLSENPARLREVIVPGKLTVIDEIQRLPELLNEVHYLIEEKSARFLMTGSSARTLRKKGINLLGGRARTFKLHPLSMMELKDEFNLLKALQFGLLPSIWFSEEPNAMLHAYAMDYLQQEIISEAAVRNVAGFKRFLTVAAHCSGKPINYTKLSSDAQVKPTTLREHFEILIDSLIATRVEPWRNGQSRKVVSSDKIFLFDTGICRILQERKEYAKRSEEYGYAFESLVYHELRCYSDYYSQEPIRYWRTTTGLEVDFILGDRLAIEVKATSSVRDPDLKGLRSIAKEANFQKRILVSNEPHARQTEDGILILPFKEFVLQLWDNSFS